MQNMFAWLLGDKQNVIGKYSFYVQYLPQNPTTSDNINIIAYTNSNKKTVLPAKYKWYSVNNHTPLQMNQVKGSTLMMTPDFVGLNILAQIYVFSSQQSEDQQYPGKAVINFPTIKLDPCLKKSLRNLLHSGYFRIPTMIQCQDGQAQCQLYVSNEHVRLVSVKDKNSFFQFSYNYTFPRIDFSNPETKKLSIGFQEDVKQLKTFLTVMSPLNKIPRNFNKVNLRFVSRISRDLFTMGCRSFSMKKQLINSYTLHKFQFTSMKQNDFQLIAEVANLQKQLACFSQQNDGLRTQKIVLKKEIIRLEQELRKTIQGFLKIIKEKNFQESILDNSLTTRKSQLENKDFKQIQLENRQLRQKLKMANEQLNLVKFFDESKMNVNNYPNNNSSNLNFSVSKSIRHEKVDKKEEQKMRKQVQLLRSQIKKLKEQKLKLNQLVNKHESKQLSNILNSLNQSAINIQQERFQKLVRENEKLKTLLEEEKRLNQNYNVAFKKKNPFVDLSVSKNLIDQSILSNNNNSHLVEENNYLKKQLQIQKKIVEEERQRQKNTFIENRQIELNQNLLNQKQKYKSECNNKNSVIEQLQKQNNQLQQKINKVIQDLNNKYFECQKLQTNLNERIEELEKTRIKNIDLLNILQQKQLHLLQLYNRNNSLKSTLKEVSQATPKVHPILCRKQGSQNNLRRSQLQNSFISERSIQLDSNDRNQQLRRKNFELQKNMYLLGQKHKIQIKKIKEEMNNQINSLKEIHQGKNCQIEQLLRVVREKDQKIIMLNKFCQGINSQKNKNHSENIKVNDTFLSERLLQNPSQKMQQLENRLQTIKQIHYIELNKLIESLKQKNIQLVFNQQKVTVRINELEEELAQKDRKIQTLTKQIQEARGEKDKLSSQNVELKMKVADLQMQIGNISKEMINQQKKSKHNKTQQFFNFSQFDNIEPSESSSIIIQKYKKQIQQLTKQIESFHKTNQLLNKSRSIIDQQIQSELQHYKKCYQRSTSVLLVINQKDLLVKQIEKLHLTIQKQRQQINQLGKFKQANVQLTNKIQQFLMERSQ